MLAEKLVSRKIYWDTPFIRFSTRTDKEAHMQYAAQHNV